MPDDNIFEGEPRPQKTEPQPQPQPQPTPQQVDLSPLVNELKALSTRMGQLENFVQSAQRTQPEPTPQLSDDDLSTQLLTDPKTTLEKQFDQFVKEKLAPQLRTQYGDRRDELIDGYKSDIDGEFGEGTWDELFVPELNDAFGNMPPEMQASRGHLRVMINAIKGDKLDKLVDKAAALEEKAEQEATAEPPAMLGAGNPRPSEPAVSQDLKDFLADYNRHTGDNMSVKDWQGLAAKGNTEDDWREEKS
jgi:hypothetical protein